MDIKEKILSFFIQFFIILIFASFCLFLNKMIFRHLQLRGKKIHLTFFERVVRIIIMVMAVLIIIAGFDGIERFWRMVFSSTVVIGGIIGFAAQGIIKDILAGLMLSMHHPFEIGDRILLSDIEMPCVVEDLTISHTILRTMDNIRYIVPNSEINGKIITNTSYHQQLRGTFIKVTVSYDSDIRKAIFAVREAIRTCPYTCPNNAANADLDGYGEVYIMGFQDNGLLLETVIWTEPETDNFLACSEVRMAILNKFREEGLKVSYPYVNVITTDSEDKGFTNHNSVSTNMGKRNIQIKTDQVEVGDPVKTLPKIMESIHEFSAFHALSKKNENTLQLLSEELINFTKQVFGELDGSYYLEGTKHKARIHLHLNVKMNADRHIQIIGISSSGENAAAQGFLGRIREMIALYPNDSQKILSYARYKNSAGSGADHLEQALLTTLSDDIKVSILDKSVSLVVYKKFAKEKAEKT